MTSPSGSKRPRRTASRQVRRPAQMRPVPPRQSPLQRAHKPVGDQKPRCALSRLLRVMCLKPDRSRAHRQHRRHHNGPDGQAAQEQKNTNLVCDAIETSRLEESINRPNENDGIMVVRIKTIKQFDNMVQDLRYSRAPSAPPALCHGL